MGTNSDASPARPPATVSPIALAIHGGAGELRREDIDAELEAAYRAALRAALDAGYAALASGSSSLDAVTVAICSLEDSPLFNSGRGAALNSEGFCELDASIMDGCTLAAGAVAAVRGVKNPVKLARAVMEKSPHVLLVGAGAEAFAQVCQVETAPDEYFITEHRRRELDLAQAAERAGDFNAQTMENIHPRLSALAAARGTVGAVALDQAGCLAAATSTGGMTNKRFGRVGDSPIVGAGVYANNATCAVSATGHGEYFLRVVAAHEVSALIEHRQWPVREAAQEAIRKVNALGGTGGIIALDRQGRVAMPFSTRGMHRAYRSSDEERIIVAIFGDE